MVCGVRNLKTEKRAEAAFFWIFRLQNDGYVHGDGRVSGLQMVVSAVAYPDVEPARQVSMSRAVFTLVASPFWPTRDLCQPYIALQSECCAGSLSLLETPQIDPVNGCCLQGKGVSFQWKKKVGNSRSTETCTRGAPAFIFSNSFWVSVTQLERIATKSTGASALGLRSSGDGG